MNQKWEQLLDFSVISRNEYHELIQWVREFTEGMRTAKGVVHANEIEDSLFERAHKRYSELEAHKERFQPVLRQIITRLSETYS